MEKIDRLTQDLIVGFLVVSGLAALTVFVFLKLAYEWDWASAWEYRGLFFQGWLLTVGIAAGALVCSILVGVLLVVGQRSGNPVAMGCCRIFIEIVRGTPLLVQILIGYYIVANAFSIDSPILMGVLLLSGFGGAYLGEIIRGGIESIGETQLESARAVGFDRFQTYRHVVVPQAVRRILPGAVGVFVMLIKDSSLLSVISIDELTRMSKNIGSRTYGQLEVYLPMAAAYLILTLPVSWIASRLEKRFSYTS